MKWLLLLLLPLGCFLSSCGKAVEEARVELANLQAEENQLKALEAQLKDEMAGKTNLLKESESSLDEMLSNREAELQDILQYIAALEKGEEAMEQPLTIWRKAVDQSNRGRKLDRIMTKTGPIIRNVIVEKVENEILFYTRDGKPGQVTLSNLSDEALKILLNEKFFTDQVSPNQ